MGITIEQLEKNMEYLAFAISTRPDGTVYLPIYKRLEKEISERNSQMDTMAQIMMKAASYSGTGAT
ncbi:hypothetical protein C1J03_02010 [Sulfitobacter sp. SK012]|uniref:hypothetical protein n=1 Tax=Sulfitobacter sp. SK012 TaxID=1389005 RepID=UPI000E0BBC1E|nr:hypothetical protein [Sulfitobacter sp. SK012]AXI44913.1 hypothetical protein C1J03_02010 [Sulfitobacter sp. SK012]